MINPTKADMASELKNFFDDFGAATSSSGGAYKSQSRGYLVGGSASMRTPTKFMQPITIQFPNIKAGCGGIDLFFGGFSYINAEEFKRFLQATGTAALGYGFQLALENTCPTCNSVLKSLKQLSQSVNQFGLDSCTAGQALANTALGPFFGGKNAAIAEAGKNTAGGGTDDSFWSPVKGWLDKMKKSVDELHRDIYEAAKNPTKTLRKVGISTMENLKKRDITETQAELAISILGTKAPKYGMVDGEIKKTADCDDWQPVLRLTELLEGAKENNPIKYYSCAEGSLADRTCERLIETQDTSFKGYKEISREVLDRIKTSIETNTDMSAADRSFINSIPNVPVLAILKNAVNINPSLADTITPLLTDTVAIAYATHVIMSFTNMYREGPTSIATCNDDPTKRFYDVYNELIYEYSKYMKQIENTNTLVRFHVNLEKIKVTNVSDKVLKALKTVRYSE